MLCCVCLALCILSDVFSFGFILIPGRHITVNRVRALDNRGFGYFLGEIWAKFGQNLSKKRAKIARKLRKNLRKID